MTGRRLLSLLAVCALLCLPAAASAQNGGGGGGGPDPGVTVQPGNKEYSIPYASQRDQAAPATKPAAKHKPAPSTTAPSQSAAPVAGAAPQPAVAAPVHTASKAHPRHHRRHHRRHRSHAVASRSQLGKATPVVARVNTHSSSSGSPSLLIGAIVAATLLVGGLVGFVLRRRGSAQRLQGELSQ